MRFLRKPTVWTGLAALAVAAAFGLYWFQPWKLLTSKTVNDAAPAVVATTGAAPTASASAAVLVAEGTFVTHEHRTTGTAQLVRLPTGGHQVILQNLATSDGPDLRVWLTDQRVADGRDGWRVFDDGRYVEVGRLKGTHGTQVYDVPADADISAMTSVTIWCKRFAVSFGAAALPR